MRNPEGVLNNLCLHSKASDYKFERLYRNLFNEQMFYVAYQRIYAKPGNMTPGTDGQTIDQMSIERIEKLIESLKNESYCPNPARRIYIPKKNGKKRPLGIPSFEDKLVQEVTRMMLEAIYEGYFDSNSHGFRPHRSCHTALSKIQLEFTGTKWFIEGDIKGFFDNINHNVLIDILSKRIADERFLRLLRKFLNAGYIEDWQYKPTYSGTPQGGIISPILANIYLDQFDKYIREYATNFNIGDKRQRTSEWNHYTNRVKRLKKKIDSETNEEERTKLMEMYRNERKSQISTPCLKDMDDTFKRMKYLRYADDFLIGVIGSKAECEKIKADITQFMEEKLLLELSAEKTLITNAQKPAKFLGYEIFLRRSNHTKRNSLGIVRRSNNVRVTLSIPHDVLRAKLETYKALSVKQVNGKDVWEGVARNELVKKADHVILAQVNAEVRGFYNYYCLAENIPAIGNDFFHIMQYSFYKTLAKKHRSTTRKLIMKYRLNGETFAIPYKDSKNRQKFVILYDDGFKRKKDYKGLDSDLMPQTVYVPYTTLAERLKENKCELCGALGKTSMHHVRKMSELTGKYEWEQIMLKKRIKTIAVCEKCNSMIQKQNAK